MKKTFIIIIIIVITIIAIIFAKYVEYSKNKTKVDRINKEFLAYQKSIVQINTIVSLTNRAIDINNKNKVEKTDDYAFIENDENSIKIYLKIESNESTIEMEKLMLNPKGGAEKVEYAFSDLLFEITNIEYHKKTGQIKSVLFEERK